MRDSVVSSTVYIPEAQGINPEMREQRRVEGREFSREQYEELARDRAYSQALHDRSMSRFQSRCRWISRLNYDRRSRSRSRSTSRSRSRSRFAYRSRSRSRSRPRSGWVYRSRSRSRSRSTSRSTSTFSSSTDSTSHISSTSSCRPVVRCADSTSNIPDEGNQGEEIEDTHNGVRSPQMLRNIVDPNDIVVPRREGEGLQQIFQREELRHPRNAELEEGQRRERNEMRYRRGNTSHQQEYPYYHHHHHHHPLWGPQNYNEQLRRPGWPYRAEHINPYQEAPMYYHNFSSPMIHYPTMMIRIPPTTTQTTVSVSVWLESQPRPGLPPELVYRVHIAPNQQYNPMF